MLSKTLVTSSGKKIHLYDNVFSKNMIEYFEDFFQNSFYTLGSASTDIFRHANRTFFQSKYNLEDLNSLGILEQIQGTKIADDIEGLELASFWVLASTYLTQYYLHTDRRNGRTLIYYGNTTWDADWGGETLFCDDKGDVEIAVSCKPNRVVVFDSAIPHKPAPLTLDADQYRFTFVAQFRTPGSK
jgi:Rps23 Pro-64 3,4-dihydroxylase Tpa1-like proline 4-hydroxylase